MSAADHSSVYDPVPDIGVLYDHVPAYAARGDAVFYAQEAAATKGEVLELGCGTGRVLLPIARAGGTITGLDSAAVMLERLRLHLAEEPAAVRSRVTAVEGDARDFDLGRRFAMITAPFRVLQHLIAVDDQLRLLASVVRHLAPGGRFIFDVFNPRFDLLVADRSAEKEDTPELRLPDGRLFRRTARIPRVRWVEQVSEVELIYYLSGGPGKPASRSVQAFEMRWYLKAELEHLLARAGLRLVSVYGSFAREPLVDSSPEQVFVAEHQ